MNKIKLIIAVFVFNSLNSYAQSDENKSSKKIEIGAELQVYPVGYMPMVTSTVLVKDNWALRFRIGGNFANRQDFSGYNDDEVASGFGGSIGVMKYFQPWGKGKPFVGLSIDTWNMWTDWQDDLETSNPMSGTTYNLVLQPWANAGYQYPISSKWNIAASVGFGREINVITRGEKVGEGWMGLATIAINYAIK
jgi:hypothetical protein